MFIEWAPSYDQFKTNIRSTVTMLRPTLQLVLTSTHECIEEKKCYGRKISPVYKFEVGVEDMSVKEL